MSDTLTVPVTIAGTVVGYAKIGPDGQIEAHLYEAGSLGLELKTLLTHGYANSLILAANMVSAEEEGDGLGGG